MFEQAPKSNHFQIIIQFYFLRVNFFQIQNQSCPASALAGRFFAGQAPWHNLDNTAPKDVPYGVRIILQIHPKGVFVKIIFKKISFAPYRLPITFTNDVLLWAIYLV